MADLTPSAAKKLKVAQLKEELTKRGLDAKGNKPVLLKRLLEALGEGADLSGEVDSQGTDSQTEDIEAEDGAEASEQASVPENLDAKPDPQVVPSVADEVAKVDGVESSDKEIPMEQESAQETTAESAIPEEKLEGNSDARSDEGKMESEDVNGDENKGLVEGMQVVDEATADESDLLDVPIQPADRDAKVIVLDDYNSDIHFRVEADGVTGATQSAGELHRLWGGARANWGVRGGKACFELLVEENVVVEEDDMDEPYRVRVGWSVASPHYDLGEVEFSYGYDGLGKKWNNNESQEYGALFGTGDVVSCYLDLESEEKTVSFSKNGQALGTAYTLPSDIVEKNGALYPHVLCKNVKVKMNFGGDEPAFAFDNGYTVVQQLPEEQKERGVLAPTSVKSCEVVLLVGLPAVGKTTWASKFISEHPEKRFNHISTDFALSKMKVAGQLAEGSTRRNYGDQWQTLLKQALAVQKQLFLLAKKRQRNYVFDQANTSSNTQRQRMTDFEEYGKRKAVVFVVTNEELAKRTKKREDEEGKLVPDEAVIQMKSSFSVPSRGRMFTDIEYAETGSSEALRVVDDFRAEAQRMLRDSSGKRSRYSSSSRGSSPRGRGGPRGPSGGSTYRQDRYNDRSYRDYGGYGGTHSYGGGYRDRGYSSGYQDDRSYGSGSSYSGYRDRYGPGGYDRPPTASSYGDRRRYDDYNGPPAQRPRYSSGYGSSGYGAGGGYGGGYNSGGYGGGGYGGGGYGRGPQRQYEYFGARGGYSGGGGGYGRGSYAGGGGGGYGGASSGSYGGSSSYSGAYGGGYGRGAGSRGGGYGQSYGRGGGYR